MKSAIIFTGGKQNHIKEGQTITIEKIDKKEGAAVTFDKVLFFSDGKKTEIGKPWLKHVKVSGKVIRQEKSDKVMVVKFRAKTRYRRKRGHRQFHTIVKIEKISVTE
jgi:large subunit ribosomal protein L21